MSDLQDLIDSADRLCASLDKAAENEKMFCYNTCLELERYSWEMCRMSNEIKELQYNYGG